MKGTTSTGMLHQALIDLWPYVETERVIVSFTLMESNK